ncbi:NACHT and WD repeat domain-containing protein 2-like [Acipenser ruthenus]|uniref:NACHT and WD repeat domain-containing protein 2-like n=1 Tax=Acipenser ruthenus TaxID=7906 RepID=UPI0027410964|nr:NACHT and WD repeat domain-containing protein 2-like [Acipenser ruthenus]
MDNSIRKALLSGDFSRIPSETIKSCIKIFLCVDPQDSQSERKALRETVYPKIREYCRSNYGLEFKVIDGYEGFDPEDVLDCKFRQFRLKLLEDCIKNSAGPCFVALIGEQSSGPCLPQEIEVLEFEEILQMSQQAGVSTRILERWYHRDENAIPPAYFLWDKRDLLRNYYSQADIKAREVDRSEWQEAFQEMKMIFDAVVSRCIQKGTITPERGRKYFTSALEDELRFALENRPKEDLQRCLCYVHNIPIQSQQREKMTQKSRLSPDPELQMYHDLKSYNMMRCLRDEFLPSIVASSQLRVYTSNSDIRQGNAKEITKEHTEGLCNHFYSDMLSMIDALVTRNTQHLDSLTEEVLQHASLCNIYDGLYRIECDEVEKVKNYLSQKETKYPLIVSGGPCTGKTVFLAHCAKQVHSWLNGCDPVVAVRFLRRDTGNLKQLLSGICQQLAVNYNYPPVACSNDIGQLKEDLANLFRASSLQHPLVLILDGVDQMAHTYEAQSMWWLPKTLPPSVKLLISTAPKKSAVLQTFKTLYPDESQFLEMGNKERKDGSKMLTELLLASKRRITSGQQIYVNEALKGCTLPLYVELLNREVFHWHSQSDVTEESLGKSVHESIERFLHHLEMKHGAELVSKAVAYLTIAKSGITENELVDILSADNNFLLRFLPNKDLLYKLRVPDSVVENLLLDLKSFLVKRYLMGFQVLCWTNRHFPLVVYKLYLSGEEARQEMHNVTSSYFSGRWACGRAKPFVISQDLFAQTKALVAQAFQNPLPLKIYIDSQQPSQPWLFSSHCFAKFANVRKINELPFHLKASGRLDEVCRSTLMCLGFHQAMLKAGQLTNLISELEETSLLAFGKELRLLASILSSAACLLQTSPADLTAVIQTKLLPFLDICPSLLNYVKQIYQEGLRNSALAVLHSSVMNVPSTRTLLSAVELSPIVTVIETQYGKIIVILENGTLWAWSENMSGGFKLMNSTGIKFSGAKSAGHFLLLSTECNRLLLYNLSLPLLLYEVNVHRSVIHSTVETLEQVKGFVISSTSLYGFVWFENMSYVGMFDLSTGSQLGQLHCQHDVMCLSCSSDCRYVFCGQQESTVTIFDIHEGGQHVATVTSDLKRTSILSLLHSEPEMEMFWVDNFGNIFVWDIETISEPQLIKEFCNPEDLDEVITIESSAEKRILLLCKREHIVIWDTFSWMIMDQFKAPRNSLFSHAVLSNNCDIIIAALEGCCFLLVWKRNTGQCVLTLNTGHDQILKLVKNHTTLVAVTANGFFTSWDLDLVLSASLVSKTGLKIKAVLVTAQGKHFYTVNGTDVIFKWNTLTGRIEAYFEHEDLVDSSALTMTGEYLVTSEISGDIYVWNTETGENLHRIRCDHVSKLLVTPNSHFVVSLCENNLSRVWKLTKMHIVCYIHPYLKNAIITPESTFVLGHHDRDLLAVSLWSGCVSKRFSSASQSEVTAFQALPDYPDYVVLITSSGYLYTWNVAEETIYQQVKLPENCLSQLEVFQISSDGRYAVISVDIMTINILDTLNGSLFALRAKGPVLYITLTADGSYVVFICDAEQCSCSCDFHAKPVLNVVQVSDMENIGQCYLCKDPSTMTVSDNLNVYVGFEDGSTGIYTIANTVDGTIKSCLSQIGNNDSCLYSEHKQWLGKELPNITWRVSSTELL